ncbi:N-acetylmuramoyl-L-alanine amidase [Marispirochaeta sp.]|uniref:N-acetylmuramoyl-L-alanine amidase family protein n=1 Tax=Marispirochaeta sp. TaxID=2038653 RepID=UPI0029C96FBC|nr:N-acetylmuramoyl-L-alanine amidase [Marispirochaeta sp.]
MITKHRKHIFMLLAGFIIAAGWLMVNGGCQSPAASAPEPDTAPAEDAALEVIPLEGPIVVALQPGHWKIDELPPEARRRSRSTGAVHGNVRELDINLAVVDALVPLLKAEHWSVILVPATVPPGLRADVFLSIHADWGADPARRGWKLAPPWRPSIASSEIAEALMESFRAEESLTEDADGVTVGMRGYFGFSSHRYRHASSPYTPAVLVELGFVTNTIDRELMVTQPEFYAGIIHRGLEKHFYTRGRSNVAFPAPP